MDLHCSQKKMRALNTRNRSQSTYKVYTNKNTNEDSKGLFVRWQMKGIFTNHKNWPTIRFIKRSNRSTVHAGRYLNNKEFCYLGTITVMADVDPCKRYWSKNRTNTVRSSTKDCDFDNQSLDRKEH